MERSSPPWTCKTVGTTVLRYGCIFYRREQRQQRKCNFTISVYSVSSCENLLRETWNGGLHRGHAKRWGPPCHATDAFFYRREQRQQRKCNFTISVYSVSSCENLLRETWNGGPHRGHAKRWSPPWTCKTVGTTVLRYGCIFLQEGTEATEEMQFHNLCLLRFLL